MSANATVQEIARREYPYGLVTDTSRRTPRRAASTKTSSG